MSRCASCGRRIFIGATVRNGQPFCNFGCARRAELAAAILRLDPTEIDAAVERKHGEPCPVCRGPGPVDAAVTVRVIGVMQVAVSETRTHVGCAACQRRAVIRDLLISLTAIFSIGIFFVPGAVTSAMRALRARSGAPSNAFRTAVAKLLLEEHATALHESVPLEHRLGGSWT